MCGIVGYVGKDECASLLVKCLKRLEYRGYDSAGIAVFEKGRIKTVKAKGKIAEGLQKKLDEKCPHGTCGIGHTRWATHGEPSDINSHPIGNGRVSVVHNGIIENYREIKESLMRHGYGFESETDTEAAVKLLDYYYSGDPIDAISKMMAKVEGAYALGILFRDFPDRIYAVRKESPLIVGKGRGENFIASDVTAILDHTKEYYILEHGEIAEITENAITFYDASSGDTVEKEVQVADWDIEAAQKGGYEHFMLKEIHEQPSALRNTISPRIKDGLPDFSECGLTDEMIRNYRQIWIVGCGSAMHAGMVGKYVTEELARIPVNVDIASEFKYRDPLIKENDLCIIISQSGETADTKAALELANKAGADTLAIVNVVGSSIAREAKMVMYTNAGPEISVCSTKAYAVQCAFMYLVAFKVAYAVGTITEEECRKLCGELCGIPDIVAKCIEDKEQYQYVASKLINADSLLYIGRGLDYALSMEGSLKLKEISYIHSESYAAGELKHGTISLIDENMPVIAVATQERLFDKTQSNVKEVKSRGAKVVLICKEGAAVDEASVDYKVQLPGIRDLLMPLVTIVPLQLIAYYTSVLLGRDVDMPRNLAKSVTVE